MNNDEFIPTTVKEVFDDIKDTEYGKVEKVILNGRGLDKFFSSPLEFETWLNNNPDIAKSRYEVGKKTKLGNYITMIITISEEE